MGNWTEVHDPGHEEGGSCIQHRRLLHVGDLAHWVGDRARRPLPGCELRSSLAVLTPLPLELTPSNSSPTHVLSLTPMILTHPMIPLRHHRSLTHSMFPHRPHYPSPTAMVPHLPPWSQTHCPPSWPSTPHETAPFWLGPQASRSQVSTHLQQ